MYVMTVCPAGRTVFFFIEKNALPIAFEIGM